MKKGVVITGAAVAALAAVIAFRTFGPKPALEEALAPTVRVETPQKDSIELYRDLVGTVEPSNVVYIYPKMPGEVTEIFVKAGDQVEEGQPICTIDTKQVDNARLNFEAAQQSLSDAQRNMTRMQTLFAAGDISSMEFEGAQTQLKGAQIQYDTAKLNYDNQVEYSHVTANIAGTIEICDMEIHENVSSQKLICVISGEGSKSVSFAVTEKVAKQLHVGDPVTIQKSGMDYEGRISEVSSMIDNATGLFKVKASVEQGDALPTGASVKLYVVSDKAENVMTIPVDAIYYSGGDAYVYLYDEGTVHYVPIEVGIYDSERAQVLSGISETDEVITTWSSELYEGSAVQKAE